MKPKHTVPAGNFLLFVLRFAALKHSARELRKLSGSFERSAEKLTHNPHPQRIKRAP